MLSYKSSTQEENESRKDKNIKVDVRPYENRIRNDNIKEKVCVAPIEEKLREIRLSQ